LQRPKWRSRANRSNRIRVYWTDWSHRIQFYWVNRITRRYRAYRFTGFNWSYRSRVYWTDGAYRS
jgi:hypothetical protein